MLNNVFNLFMAVTERSWVEVYGEYMYMLYQNQTR